jgi:hypothetical protein
MNKSKKFSLAILGFSLLCFTLPFVSVSCNNQKISITGLEMVTGTTIQRQRLDPQPFAVLAVLATAVALALTFADQYGKPKVIGILAALAAVFLLVTKSQLDSQLARNGGFVQANWEIGFWLAVISDAVAVAIQFLIPVPQPDLASTPASTPNLSSPPDSTP